MKCISVRQPWAHLLLRDHDRKDVENRTWGSSYRGPLLIHAAKGMTRAEYDACREFCLRIGAEPPPAPERLTRGAIVGRVDIVAWTHNVGSPWHARGQFGIYTRGAVRFPEPIPYRGALGLFDVPDFILDALANQDSATPGAERHDG